MLTDNYDSVSNFIALYDAFENADEPLYQLFRKYTPPIRAKKHTCVGLGIEIIRRWRSLDKQFPGFAEATALVSCEEAVENVQQYVSTGDGPWSVPGAEKEHVMVCVQITLDGRPGVLLADPGYHVARVVTVMADRAYPHTGWFTQSEEGASRKEYSYAVNAAHPGYVEWRERVGGRCRRSLVYVARPYLDAVHVTERRNLVYNFRSLLARDQKGHLVAGIYFPVGARGNEANFTLFYDNGTEKKKTKYKFSAFADSNNVLDSISEEVELCNTQMGFKKGELHNIICKLTNMLSNQSFIEQLLEINDDICRLCL